MKTGFCYSSAALLLCAHIGNAQRALYSNSFQPCLDNSAVTAEYFNATVTPDNNTITYDWSGESTYSGNATILIVITVDSETVYNTTEDPCRSNAATFCPATPGQVVLYSNQTVPDAYLERIPEDVYTTANPDANLRLYLNNAGTGEPVGCLQANLMNDASQASSEGNSTSSTNATSTDGANSTSSSNSTGGADADSGAGTAYLNWALLL
ncbi:Putative ML-like domain, transient receptor potential channel Flc/Pkd2 [Septoria linicola]|uniref:ML-like domain, transient receptor potential channel Flc/Pkd2 n=1 Tax=Septoria linicola TaxID=215465 RepID=A0A9Q9AK48_9PEZI|nr:putative ML-like domain, transient receptor potential channel Flc/Pkd2 [Septoria linicola]USW50809.1 Putative ML-like domain, transient receptor potential channel Flc/Pkd2 [Septoria linicola]